MRAKMAVAAERERDAHYLYDRHDRTFPQLIKVEKYFPSEGAGQRWLCRQDTLGDASHCNVIVLL